MKAVYVAMLDLVDLCQAALTRPQAPVEEFERRHYKVTAEIEAICTALPSRKQLCDVTKITAMCLDKLFLARRANDPWKITFAESAVGFFLPFLKLEAHEAMCWEREQGKS